MPSPRPCMLRKYRLTRFTASMRVQGAKPVPFLMAVGLGLALRFLVPIPVGITVQAWTLLSIFVSTIAGKLVAGLQHQSDARATTHHHTANLHMDAHS